MLLLIFAHGHMGGVIDQNIRCHQSRIAKKTQRGILTVFTRFIFPLRHALHPAHARDTIENPAQLRMFWNLTLIEKD